MSTKSYILIPYWLQDCKVQSWRKSYFLAQRGYNSILEAKKSIFGVDMDQETLDSCS